MAQIVGKISKVIRKLGLAAECAVLLIPRLFSFHHVGFVPYAFAESLHTDQVAGLASLFFNKADPLVLCIFDPVAHFEFRITHTFSVRAKRDFRTRRRIDSLHSIPCKLKEGV